MKISREIRMNISAVEMGALLGVQASQIVGVDWGVPDENGNRGISVRVVVEENIPIAGMERRLKQIGAPGKSK